MLDAIVQVTLTRERKLPEKQKEKLGRDLVAEKFASGRRSSERRKRGCCSVRGRKTSLLRGLFVLLSPLDQSRGNASPPVRPRKCADDGRYNVEGLKSMYEKRSKEM